MAFEIGQEVECIDDNWFVTVPGPAPSHFPKKGKVYVVAGIHRPCLDALHQVDHLSLAGILFHMFASDMFRPLLRKKTDISVFTKMLKPAKVPENA